MNIRQAVQEEERLILGIFDLNNSLPILFLFMLQLLTFH